MQLDECQSSHSKPLDLKIITLSIHSTHSKVHHENKKKFATNVSSHYILAFVFETSFIRRTRGRNQGSRRNDTLLKNHAPNSVVLLLQRLSIPFSILLLFLTPSSLQIVNIVYLTFIK